MELIAVIAIVAVVAAFAGARFSGGFARTQAVSDELLAQLTFARRTAIAQRRVVCVHIAANQSTLFYSDAAGTACPGSATVAGALGTVPTGSAFLSGTISPTVTFQFDALGSYRASNGVAAGANLAISIIGSDGSHVVTVERETGYVR